jgi:two-component system chemotaxis response regulator CheB
VRRASGPPSRVDIGAIGVSTGGPTALAELIPALPVTLPVPVVIVQHMPPMFTRVLAERLDLKSALHAVEAADGARLAPGTVYIAPGDLHMEVSSRERLRTFDGPHENSCRPSVDPLFRSVATQFGPHALAIVLTGMGRDGLRGAEEIARAGGHILVQDEASSVVWGMPGAAWKQGAAEEMLPLDMVPARLIAAVRR